MLGFPREPRSFEVFYREFPISFTQILADSMATGNDFAGPRTKRLLVGEYLDPVFGRLRAEAYTQVRPGNAFKVLEENAVYDSVTLHFIFDYYNYGAKVATPLTFSFHELTEVLDETKIYDNRSVAEYDPIAFASRTITIDPVRFDTILAQNIKDTVMLSCPVDHALGQRLFDMLASKDSTIEKFSEFKKAFRGMAIIPRTADKIVGFNPASSGFTQLNIHYHVDTLKYTYPFVFDYTASFTRLQSGRDASELASINTPRVEYELINGKVYAQSGTGIFPKLTFQPLINLHDTVPEIAFTSVELEIPVSTYNPSTPPPPQLGMRLLRKNNTFASTGSLIYSQNLAFSNSGNEIIPIGVFIRNDLGLATSALKFDRNTKTYRGFITDFAEKLVREDDPTERFLNFALFAMKEEANKAVDRIVFNPADVKLKVYYARPARKANTN